MNAPNGLQQIKEAFGNPCGVSLAIVTLKQPIGAIQSIRCNVNLRDTLQQVFDEIADSGKAQYLFEYAGCFCCRSIRGNAQNYSTHSWGIAVDLNESHNTLGSIPPAAADLANAPYVFTLDHPIVQIFKKYGFLWGGEFHHRKDPMHFQFATGY